MAINIYLSTTESKENKANKQNRNRIVDTENTLMVAKWEGCQEYG